MKRVMGLGVSLLALALAAACGDEGPAVGVLRGFVRDTSGAGLQDVFLSIRVAGGGPVVRGATTGPAGDYSIGGLPPGGYEVLLQLPPATVVDEVNPASATLMGGDTAQVDFTLRYLAVRLAFDVQPLFTTRCAFCHGGGAPQAGLDLDSGQAYVAIVNVPSVQAPDLDLVEPGAPDASYLIHKVQGTQGDFGPPSQTGGQMPQGAPALNLQTIRMLRRWVTEGALNN